MVKGGGSYGTCLAVSHSFVGESWANKAIILVFCRLSETPIGGADGRFWQINVSLRNYKSAGLLALLRKELGGLLFTSAVGRITLRLMF